MTGREMLAVIVAALLAAVIGGAVAAAAARTQFLQGFGWVTLGEGLFGLLSGVAILGRAGMGKVTRIAFEYRAPWETERHRELGASLGYVLVGVLLTAAGAALLFA